MLSIEPNFHEVSAASHSQLAHGILARLKSICVLRHLDNNDTRIHGEHWFRRENLKVYLFTYRAVRHRHVYTSNLCTSL